MSSTESTSSVAIGNFPNELILEIGQYLDYPSAIFFAATNRLNRALIDPPQLSQKEKLEFAIRAEGFNQHSLSSESGPGYACPECFCVRKEEHFDRKHCVKSPERITPNHLLVRNCTECRDTYRTLYHGDAVLFIEKYGLPRPQWKCTLYEYFPSPLYEMSAVSDLPPNFPDPMPTLRSSEAAQNSPDCNSVATCSNSSPTEKDLQEFSSGTQQDSEFSRPATELGVFGKLPVELLLEIYDHLDYDAAIFFAATNKFWRDHIEPTSMSDETKKLFLDRAMRFRQHNGRLSESSFACYGCWRMRKWTPIAYWKFAEYTRRKEVRPSDTGDFECLECQHFSDPDLERRVQRVVEQLSNEVGQL
ncbi:hypothetical protein IWZ00DRAFT_552496 [Phyllosticta capitalensis]